MPADVEILTVVYADPDDDEGAESVLGQVSFGPGGLLEVADADPRCEEFLNGVVEMLNDKSAVVVKVPGAERGVLSSQVYERSGADFLQGVKEYLKQYYAIELRSNRDIVTQADDYRGLTA